MDDQYYTWSQAAPLILSLLAFRQPLPTELLGESLNSKLIDNQAQIQLDEGQELTNKPPVLDKDMQFESGSNPAPKQ
jgi:hypothetical protein